MCDARGRAFVLIPCRSPLSCACATGINDRMQADYVIVGAGSAGCALAARLATPGRTVVLIEAGERRDNAYTRMPGGDALVGADPRYATSAIAEADPTAGRRRLAWPAARVVGGGSAIGMPAYARGWASDYDAWAQRGARGWAWSDVAPYFERIERWSGPLAAGRGRGGPLSIAPVATDGWRETLAQRFLEACAELGVPRLEDVNAPHPDGAGRAQAMLRDGRRWSVADAYLRPRRRDPNLTLLARARVLRLQMDGRRCIGVFVRHDGRELQVRARSEVILAAGTFGTPKLLMHSGIGAPGLLAAAGVRLVHALPGVGANLSAQVAVPVVAHSTLPTPRGSDRGGTAALAALRWLATRGGAYAAPLVLAECSVRSDAALPVPDLRVQLLAAAVRAGEDGVPGLARERGVSALVSVRQPRARGRVCVRSADPDAPVRVEHLALMDADEVRRLVAGVRWLRRAHAMPALASLVGGELAPGVGAESDAELERYVREGSVTQPNAVGTCRLGADDDADAVVDPELRVRGIRGLRVVDASVLPFAPGAHTVAAAVMLAERAADLVAAGERR